MRNWFEDLADLRNHSVTFLRVDANLILPTGATRQFTARPALSTDLPCEFYRQTAHKDVCLTSILPRLGCRVWSVYQKPPKSTLLWTRKQPGDFSLILHSVFHVSSLQILVCVCREPLSPKATSRHMTNSGGGGSDVLKDGFGNSLLHITTHDRAFAQGPQHSLSGRAEMSPS